MDATIPSPRSGTRARRHRSTTRRCRGKVREARCVVIDFHELLAAGSRRRWGDVTLFFWDASDFDWARGPMDLNAAKADGITAFTHKATEGTSVQHTHTGEALSRALNAGMEFIGAYHVVRSVNVLAQVDYFLSYLDQVAPWWRAFPGFFMQVDLELWPYDQVSASTGMAFASALVAAQPKRVITYASRGQYGNSLTGI